MKKIAPMLVGVALLVGAGSFYGGMTYAKSKSPRMMTFNREGGMPGGGSGAFRVQGGGRTGGGGFVAGEILSKDDASITVKLMDGGSKIVFLSDATTINKSAEGTKEDLAVGAQVLVTGKAGSDGSLTAASVQIGGGFGMRGGMAPGGATPPKP